MLRNQVVEHVTVAEPELTEQALGTEQHDAMYVGRGSVIMMTVPSEPSTADA